MRPLEGEPLALDLVNTQWRDGGVRHDLLDDPEARREWMAGMGLPGADRPAAVRALRDTRTTIRAVLESPGDPAARASLNAVLGRGRITLALTDEGPARQLELAAEHHKAAWMAAASLIELLEQHSGRIRRCAHPECILYFLDTSRRGDRRWCSMRTCGNRAKAQRHYDRHRRS
ncbi:CGNR zinc finger domain-containing protein [Streptomyces sp. 8N616]|uniref:CGNR zinc finger domain-containing protein n=1 Tax=Streptomyces sp. 8N616 TaxID=3457414 RepID=UPI003FD17229